MVRAAVLSANRPASAATTIEGVLERVTFASEENAWSVVKLGFRSDWNRDPFGEEIRRLGIRVVGVPQVAARPAEGLGPDQDSVGAGAQQRHDETVGLVAPADDAARLPTVGQRDDAVHRRDEVRVDARAHHPEAAAIADREAGRQLVSREIRALEEELQFMVTLRARRSGGRLASRSEPVRHSRCAARSRGPRGPPTA